MNVIIICAVIGIVMIVGVAGLTVFLCMDYPKRPCIVHLDSIQAQVLARRLEDAGAQSWEKHEITLVEYKDNYDTTFRFVIEPKEATKLTGGFPTLQPA